MIPPVPHVAAMAGYALAELTPPTGKRLISLSQNESLRPPSSEVAKAIYRVANAPQLYPDPDWCDLRAQISHVHGVRAGQVICGNGSLDLIGALARAYLESGRAALVPEHAYPFFRTATQMTGARLDVAPEVNATVQVDTLLAHMADDTQVVFVANPGNPTGTRIPRSEICRLRDGLPDDVLLVVDEAYGEFSDHLNEPVFDLVEGGNTVVLRTLSKAYGLAGMRVGWGLFPTEIAGQIRKLLNPNNVAVAGQLAATAAMQDQAYMRETCALTAQLRDVFAARLRKAGLDVPESFTNFVLIRFPSVDAAADADANLRSEGVFLRPQAGAGLPDCLRATIAQADDMDFAANLLEDWSRDNG